MAVVGLVLGNVAGATDRELAQDGAGCHYVYFDTAGRRGINKICKTSKSEFFVLDDSSAPLLESKVLSRGKQKYLATRWAAGASEEVVLFDFALSKPAVRWVSEGPATISLDPKRQTIVVTYLVREGVGMTATGTTKKREWPEGR